MGKYVTLKAAAEAAEAALATSLSDAALTASEDADKALFAYVDRVQAGRLEFETLERSNPVVDVCVCMENAAGVKQDGHDENDIEYWSVMVATAREQIQSAMKDRLASRDDTPSFDM